MSRPIRLFDGLDHARLYRQFRPIPPDSLFKRIVSFLDKKKENNNEKLIAVDVGCGSGQSTIKLADYFDLVTGIDVSEAQIKEAVESTTNPNINFKVNSAEHMPSFNTASVHVVTVSQAIHWFDIPAFYKEVDRILCPGGVVAIYGYHFTRAIGTNEDRLYDAMMKIYKNDTAEYWSKEHRQMVDDAYTTLPAFPYGKPLRDETYFTEADVTVADCIGYIQTWSGFQSFKKHRGDKVSLNLLNRYCAEY